MVIDFKSGKIVVTPFELVVRLNGEHRVTLQAQSEAVQLIGKGANVISVNGSEAKWSIKLDNEQQLQQIAAELGCEIL
ncbi:MULTISPECIES: DUF3389 domain-containing protein [Vibrio]|uniref:DUF3389 domain-containing protein n=1 Tax=Vibrio ostreae TaxID=2841925 RepID=A0A975U8G2_9VIBR|nr:MULTISPECIES: DUF3389 domain-containing protein [Vibrio]QXO16226.1 DUF3389 domain-containing protein [Vibrio ostreae]WGY45021.1 DUF3389 domain-containing protein [Vibrio sp. ABG19]